MPRYTLEAVLVVLLVLWILGAFVFPVGGSLIHLLVFVAMVVFVVRLFQGRRVMD